VHQILYRKKKEGLTKILFQNYQTWLKSEARTVNERGYSALKFTCSEAKAFRNISNLKTIKLLSGRASFAWTNLKAKFEP
jgi:hypothetical protein